MRCDADPAVLRVSITRSVVHLASFVQVWCSATWRKYPFLGKRNSPLRETGLVWSFAHETYWNMQYDVSAKTWREGPPVGWERTRRSNQNTVLKEIL
jgi:hypothetical protein